MGSLSLTEVVYPIVVGVVLLLGQFLIQPLIARREHQDRAKWEARREIYSRALQIVNQKFASVDWSGNDVPPEAASIPKGDPPRQDDVNGTYAELALFSKRDIVRGFADCFGSSIAAPLRMELITSMREDLNLGASDLQPGDTWFVLQP